LLVGSFDARWKEESKEEKVKRSTGDNEIKASESKLSLAKSCKLKMIEGL